MVLVTGPSCKYILTVLRKAAGDRIDVMDGKGYLYRCMIHAVKGKELYLHVMDAVHHPEEKRTKVTLLVSPIKGPRMDWLVEKATELGVDRILPTIFKRTVVRFQDGERRSASGGSGSWSRRPASRAGSRSPRWCPPTPLRGVLPYIDHFENRWLLYEREKSTTMKDVLAAQKNGEVCVAIGPEGGIDEGRGAVVQGERLRPLHARREHTEDARQRRSSSFPIIFYEFTMR